MTILSAMFGYLQEWADAHPNDEYFEIDRPFIMQMLKAWNELYPEEKRVDLECLYDKPMIVGATTDWDYLQYCILELSQQVESLEALNTNRATYPTYCIVADDGEPCATNHIACEATRDQHAAEGSLVGIDPYTQKLRYYDGG
jgi:hypothetical protein